MSKIKSKNKRNRQAKRGRNRTLAHRAGVSRTILQQKPRTYRYRGKPKSKFTAKPNAYQQRKLQLKQKSSLLDSLFG